MEFSEPFNSGTSSFSIAIQNDTTIWFASRNNGALSYNPITEKSKIIQFPYDNGFAANEVFYITKSVDMLFATGNGLGIYNTEIDSSQIIKSLPPRPIHAILNDKEGNIFVSSNYGITMLDSNYNYKATYDKYSGLEIIEYSDGACYLDTLRNTMYFGGINGFTIINEQQNSTNKKQYNPQLNITNFIQNNESSAIDLKIKNGKLRIPYSKSIFAIKFSVVDNINYPDYQFSYYIEGYDNKWKNNSGDIIYMPALSSGNYILKIKYSNKSTLYESPECCLPIYIIPPAYKRWWAITIYVIIVILALYKIIQYSQKKTRLMQDRIKAQFAEEIQKVKSNTTNSITEELSVQITFILGLCEQIRQQTHNNAIISNKVNLVEYNISKINQTLLILNEFKDISDRMTSSEEIALVQVSHITSEMLEIIKSHPKSKDVTILHSIEKDIIVPINKEAFLMLFNSIIYNMISITVPGKEININISREENNGGIVLTASTTTNNDSYKSFSYLLSTDYKNYQIDNIDKKNNEEFNIILSRKLIEKMNGSINIAYNNSNNYIILNLSIPQHSLDKNYIEYTDSHISENIDLNPIIDNNLINIIPQETQRHLETIYLISLNNDISSFLSYLLSEKYNIQIYNKHESLFDDISKNMPVAIIYDVSTMIGQFNSFMEQLKMNKITCQIPVVALTSSLQITEREECTKSGADLCISFPFNMEYLNSALEKILNKCESTAEYYKSSVSTFIVKDGKIIHKDDRIFLDNFMKIIDENISNPELKAGMIAEKLGISKRVLYRKLETITDKKPLNIIKDIRIELAVKLLATSKLTIEEIMYKTGYDNRSSFYRNFKEAKGMTPKEFRSKTLKSALEGASAELCQGC